MAHLSAPSDFGFFSCVGYLHPIDQVKSVKKPVFEFRVKQFVPCSGVPYLNVGEFDHSKTLKTFENLVIGNFRIAILNGRNANLNLGNASLGNVNKYSELHV